MKIRNFYGKTIDFFREHNTRYGCIAAVEKMLLAGIDEELLEKDNKAPVAYRQTQHVPSYDTGVLYVKDMLEKEQQEQQERFAREEARRLRNRRPRRK